MNRTVPPAWQPASVLLTALAALSLIVASASALSASPNASCLACHNRVAFDPVAFGESVHGALACSDCHQGFSGDPHGHDAVDPPAEEWLRAVIAVESLSAAGEAWAACQTCHPEVFTEMAASRHIVPAVEQQSADGAFCRDCHGQPHYLGPAPTGRALRFQFVIDTCVPCHSDPLLIANWGMNPDVVYTYEGSIHGRAARLGSERAPTCVDCHEAHHVARGDDPNSPIGEANRVEVCARCHEGASENFASVFSHTRITRESRPVEYWATFFFVSLTLITIFLLMVHMLLDLIAGLRQQFSKR